jgi:hypothetical protein
MVSRDTFWKSISGVVSGAHVRIHFGRLSRVRPIGHMLDEFLWAPAGSILVGSLGLVSWAHVQGILSERHPQDPFWQALFGLVSWAHVLGFSRQLEAHTGSTLAGSLSGLMKFFGSCMRMLRHRQDPFRLSALGSISWAHVGGFLRHQGGAHTGRLPP